MARCPICSKDEVAQKFRPFCSKRCADVDLHRWMGGQYAIPAVEPPDDWEATLDAALTEGEDGGEGPSELH